MLSEAIQNQLWKNSKLKRAKICSILGFQDLVSGGPPVSAPVYSLRIFQFKYPKILWEFQIFVYAASTNALVQIILAEKAIH